MSCLIFQFMFVAIEKNTHKRLKINHNEGMETTLAAGEVNAS